MKRKLVLGGAAAGLVLVTGIGVAVANANGGPADGYGGSGHGGGTPGTGGAGQAATVTTSATGLGQTLTDSRGRTLYLFEADGPHTSNCDNACASVWPPLTTIGAPHAGGDALAGQLGTVHRGDGSTQVTYHGHPLYLYVGDSAPGATRGEGLEQFGAEWYALAPSGNKIDHD